MIRFSKHELSFLRITLILFLSLCYATNVQAQNRPLKIQQFSINDSIHEPVKLFVDSLERDSPDWASGKGYFKVYISEPFDPSKDENPVLRRYQFLPGVLEFDNAPASRYPLFYTKIAGRVVLLDYSDIHINGFMNYKIRESSKRRFRNMMEPFLFPIVKTPRKGRPKSGPGSKKKERSTPYFYLHPQSLIVDVYYDGTIKYRYKKGFED